MPAPTTRAFGAPSYRAGRLDNGRLAQLAKVYRALAAPERCELYVGDGGRPLPP